MSSLPAAADDQDEGAAPGIGEEDGGVMNEEGNIDYLDRAQDQGGTADITDSHGNIYTVTLDDLAAVGVDVSDSNRDLTITEEQMNALLSMVAPEDGLPPGPMKADEYEEESTRDQVTLSILYDGSIKLVNNSNGHESYYSHSQLAEINIDTHNLSDEDIKRIVQLAGAASGEQYDEVSEKRRKLNSGAAMEERRDRGGGEGGGEQGQGQGSQQRMQPAQRSYQSIHVPPHSAASTSSGLAAASSSSVLVPARVRSSSSISGRLLSNGIIGEHVKIQNAKGKIATAVVRYSIPSRGYKVQYPDGKFEWVPPDKIIDRAPRSTSLLDYDHKGYASEPPPSHAAASTSSGGPLMLTRRVFAAGVSSGGQQRAIPIRQLAGPAPLHPHPPNFCCPVCDRKVYQKEPAYIVIRLPACDSCTREKILIVDENTNGGGETSRPTTREIATDTSDLLQQDEEEKTDEVPSAAPSPEEEEEEEATTPEEREGRREEGTERSEEGEGGEERREEEGEAEETEKADEEVDKEDESMEENEAAATPLST